jgi:hypothetical protein
MGQKFVIPLVVIVLLLFLIRLNEMNTRMRTFEEFIASTTDDIHCVSNSLPELVDIHRTSQK